MRRDALGRKARHGVQLSELHARLHAAGVLRHKEQEVAIGDGIADARTVIQGHGEVWWEIERARRFDRWDLYRRDAGRRLCAWTTDALSGQTVPAGCCAAVGSWHEDPIAIVRRLPDAGREESPRPSLGSELSAGAAQAPTGPLRWQLPTK